MKQAQAILANSNADDKHIVLLSDGIPTYSYAITNTDNYLQPFGLSGNDRETTTTAKVLIPDPDNPVFDKMVNGGKTIDLKDSTEALTYSVAVDLPKDLRLYKSLSISDELPSVLLVEESYVEVDGVKHEALTGKIVKVGNHVSLKIDDFKDLCGKKLSLVMIAKIDPKATPEALAPYIEAGKIENTGKLSVNQKPEVTSTATVNLPDPTPVTIDPPIEKIVTGEGAPPFAAFKFEMRRVTPEAPMPEGSVDGVKTHVLIGAGSFEFGDIEFVEPGVYVYELRELEGEDERFAYDDKTYVVTATVVRNGLSLEVEVTRTVKGEEKIVDTLVFTNEFKPVPRPTPAPLPTPTPAPTPAPGPPKTGEGTPSMIWPALLILLGGALLVMKRRRYKA